VRYELLGISLILAAWLAFNTLASLGGSCLWRVIHGWARRWPASVCANVLFALRIVPPAATLLCIATLLIPAYLIHEPRQTEEIIGPELATLAFLSAAGVLLAFCRGWKAWLATRRLLADWLNKAQPVRLPEFGIPAYRLKHRFPLIAVVGVLNPRLFIEERIFETLTAEEIRAALAHEAGHLAAHDNLKRIFLRLCRDVLTLVPCGRLLDRAWREASEWAADEHAAKGGPAVALNLAAALIKIARLVPQNTRPDIPAVACLLGDEAGTVEQRVQRLVRMASHHTVALPCWIPRIALLVAGSCLLFMAAVMVLHAPQILVAVHSAMECVVGVLQ
jgi:Zn-dependent protease with chaperone function